MENTRGRGFADRSCCDRPRFPAAIRALDDVETEKEREREKETDGQMDGRTGGRTDREEYRKIEREKKTERREKGGWEG